MQTQDKPPDGPDFEATEREWKRVRAVEDAHSAFHMNPSPATADALEHALVSWRGRAIAPVPLTVDREALRVVVGGVLWNAANYPRKAQPYLLGTDSAPLTGKVTDAVISHLSAQTVESEVEAKLRVAATVPFPGPHSDAHFMRTAAKNLEGHFDVGGSHVRAAVVRVLRVVAEAVEVRP